MPEIPNILGPQLRALRVAQGKSQTDVAQAVGISRTTLVNIEKGMDAQISGYQGVARALGVSLGLGADSVEMAERRKARQENEAKLAASREKHLKIAALMALGGEPAQKMQSDALHMVALWKEKDLCSPVYIERWSQILDAPSPQVAHNLLAMDEEWGPALRQNTPFALTLP